MKKASLKALFKLRKEIGNHFSENIKLFDALIPPYSCVVVKSGVLTVMAISIQTQKNKYCNNNACRAKPGRFPHGENNCHKLSQVAYNGIKWL